MSLATACRTLCVRLEQLREAISAVRLAVVEDKPLRGDVALVERRGNSIEDILGAVEETLAKASSAHRALQNDEDARRVRRALVACQERFNEISHRFSTELVSYERVMELTRLGRERGGEWLAWSSIVRESLRRCEQAVFETTGALLSCWREVVEKEDGGVTVHTTAIGQQFAATSAVVESLAQQAGGETE